MPQMKRLIELERYHVFRFAGEERLRLLNENHISEDDPQRIQFEYHTIYKDGRTNLNGVCRFNRLFAETQMVVDLGDFYDWMRENHPIRYKRENWEESRPKRKEE